MGVGQQNEVENERDIECGRFRSKFDHVLLEQLGSNTMAKSFLRYSDANHLFGVTTRLKGQLSNQEVESAIMFCLRREQAILYPKEIKVLKENEGMRKEDPITVGGERLQRLGGRKWAYQLLCCQI